MISAFETYFMSLKDKKVAVLGLGVSNRPLVRLLLEFGCDVLGCDRTPREKLEEEVLELEKLGARLQVGENYLEGLRGDVVFRTPGMHPDIPALKALREQGAEDQVSLHPIQIIIAGSQLAAALFQFQHLVIQLLPGCPVAAGHRAAKLQQQPHQGAIADAKA